MDDGPKETVSTTVIIVGSGFGGQCAALMLRDLGLDDFRILERRDFMGGTWCQNTYPGAQVDVPSPLYSLSAEPWDWSQMYAPQAELREYTEHVITRHGLREYTDLSTAVTGMRWDEDRHEWIIQTSSTQDYRARFVINATGPLSKPQLPSFPGQDRFAGPSFHTNSWDHSVDLQGKRVAVVGSGASAAQVIPAIAPEVAELHVFQRTPHWSLAREDHTFSPWQRALLRRPWAYRLLRALIYWRLESRFLAFKYATGIMERVVGGWGRAHLEASVRDPVLRAKLTPDYVIGCKRVLLSNTLYPALCRDNVTLHDNTDAITEVVEEGLRTARGAAIELDLIVYATGYDAVHGLVSYPVEGREGHSLAETWADFPRAYLGTTVPHFPNFFVITGPNTGIGHTSAIFIIESQMRYIRRCLQAAEDAGAGVIAVKPEAEERYTSWVHEAMQGTVWQAGGCRSWYQSRTGRVVAMFPGFTFTFWRWCGRFRPADHLLG